ncbi:LysR family transcriptional regulator [Nonomuraea longicatena]|uniref:LysR family transcriptional regulator n=1 Tax=Nonomuraea longicatena TaxID=83682 RepID=A0ABN1PFB6_9ACTN
MNLSLDDLKVFQTVAAAGSFGRGGALLHLSQPTVSERMSRLERDLGQRLFLRSGRGVRLTTAGERLLPYADRLLTLADEAVTAARAEDERPRLRVAMHATFAPSTIPRVLDALAPLDVEVTCTDAHSEDVVRFLHDGSADAGFVVPCPHPSTVTVEPFLATPVVCVVSPGHELARAQRPGIRDLAAFAVACNTWGDGAARFLSLLRAAAIPSSRLHLVSPAETVANLARRGTHVGLLTRSTVAADLATGILVEVPLADLPRWEIIVGLAYRTEDADTEPIRALRTAFRH